MNLEKGNNLQNTNNNLKQNNEEETKYKIFYSQYGYIKILEKDISNNILVLFNFIQYKNNNSRNEAFVGTIYKNNIKDNINIRLKYFSGSRNMTLIGQSGISKQLAVPSYLPKHISRSLSSVIIGIFLPFRNISAVSLALTRGEQ